MTIGKEDFERHDNALIESISRKRLVNILNHVNFKGNSVAVNLKGLRNGSRLSLKAMPEPCHGDTVHLTWLEEISFTDTDEAYELADFLIDRGSKVIVVDGQLTDIGGSGVTVLLPEHCHATSRRRAERFGSTPVHTTLSQDGLEAKGLLQDFGGGFLKVRLAARDAGILLGSRSERPLRVALARAGFIVYEGEAFIKRPLASGENIDLVLALIPYVGEKIEDSREAALDPALVVICRHPLSDKIIRLHVAKVSYNSFVVGEDPEHAVFFPGLIIPEMKIDFGAGDSAQCIARVVAGQANAWFMSILDMPIPDQRKLFSFVEKRTGMGSGVSAVIDPEDLIEFFFEAGFIYPEKYAALAGSRENLKDVLSRLYVDAPSVSQHFVQYNGDVVEGHICMVKFYERACVVQHHTAIGGVGAGSAVLAQIFRYIHSYSAFPSTGIDYAMTYYRPENRFPDRVLGGLARSLNTPSLCSIDAFAYLHLHFDGSGRETHEESEWQLGPASREDLLKLAAFYESASGGLTLKAFGLEADRDERKTVDLEAEFKKAGLRRKKHLFSLRRHGEPKAVMMALDSDAGLNMSNLMKCIHVFVIDKEGLPYGLLISQLKRLSYLYEEREVPILLFPSAYAGKGGVAPEKVYNLLVFHVSVGKRFIEFIERMTNRGARRRYGAAKAEEGEARER